MSAAGEWRCALGVDVGGTFTDLGLADLDRGKVTIHKTPSTPSDPAHGFIDGVKAICVAAGMEPGQIDNVFHGTTVETNAMLT